MSVDNPVVTTSGVDDSMLAFVSCTILSKSARSVSKSVSVAFTSFCPVVPQTASPCPSAPSAPSAPSVQAVQAGQGGHDPHGNVAFITVVDIIAFISFVDIVAFISFVDIIAFISVIMISWLHLELLRIYHSQYY